MLSRDAPGFFPSGDTAQAEGTDAVSDPPVSRLKAGADPAAPAGLEPAVLCLMSKM